MGLLPKDFSLGPLLRVAVFVVFAALGLWLLPPLMLPVGGLLVTAVLATFAAAAIANALCLRIYERARLDAIGMQWNRDSVRNLLAGLAGGAVAALLVLVPPLLLGLAEMRPNPEMPLDWGTLAFVSVLLIFGAIGEEMLFRGYGFQVLISLVGPFATILPAGFLFGVLHSGNQGGSNLSLANTTGWGIILGVAFLRSGDLWFPIGLHLGWNWVLPLMGVPLSGFPISLLGRSMHWQAGEIWSGGAYGPEGGVLTSIVLLLLGVYLWRAPVHGQEPFLLRPRKEG